MLPISRQLSKLQLDVRSGEKEKQGAPKGGWARADPSNLIRLCRKETGTESSFCHGFKTWQNF